LEGAIKEALRLHPPLILLLRQAMTPFEVGGFEVPEGWLVGASPAVSNRAPEVFERAGEYDPRRYVEPRHDDLDNPWDWIPFGAGRHRCVGAAFALMQLKAVFLVLLRDWTFEMAQDPDTYRNDHSKMVVQLARPARVRYRKRTA
jgi:sterol 14-demethylase